MALQSAKYTSIHTQTGDDKDKLKDEFDAGHAQRLALIPDKEPLISAIMYQIGLMQEELDYLRGIISSNNDKTGITTGQASAITANTSKVSMTLGTSGSTALAGDTKIVDYVRSSDTNITIGNMASAIVKGQAVYTLPITVTQSGTDKLGNPTTLTKTAALTLA